MSSNYDKKYIYMDGTETVCLGGTRTTDWMTVRSTPGSYEWVHIGATRELKNTLTHITTMEAAV